MPNVVHDCAEQPGHPDVMVSTEEEGHFPTGPALRFPVEFDQSGNESVGIYEITYCPFCGVKLAPG